MVETQSGIDSAGSLLSPERGASSIIEGQKDMKTSADKAQHLYAENEEVHAEEIDQADAELAEELAIGDLGIKNPTTKFEKIGGSVGNKVNPDIGTF